MTATELLHCLRGYGPAVEGTELVFDTDLPIDLDRALTVLHTGVRALLTGRRWWGCSSETGRAGELNPAAPIPDGVALRAADGDPRWDRIRPDARIDLPKLFFATPATVPRSRRAARAR